MNLKKTMAISLMALSCGACIDQTNSNLPSASSEPKVYRGRLVSPIVAGLNYQSGAQVGITDADGYFRYEVDKPIQFTAAGVSFPIFTVRGDNVTPTLARASTPNEDVEIVTIPIYELAESPLVVTPASISFDSTVVLNSVRILLMLDDDGNPDNGVSISPTLQTSPPTDIDLAAPNLESTGAQLQAIAQAASPGVGHSWSSEAEAATYLQARRTCALTGFYRGSLSLSPVTGNITAIVSPPFGSVAGFVRTRYGDPYSNGMFKFSIDPDDPSVGSTVGSEIHAVLHSLGHEWPTAGTVPNAPPFILHLDWQDSRFEGAWELESWNGSFSARIIANTDDDKEFPALHRFVQFPVRWTHAQGHSMYDAMIIEIARDGAVSARLFSPEPGAGDNEIRFTGNVSSTSEITAVSRSSIGGDISWELQAQFDRASMTLRNAKLYQTYAGTVADDFRGFPIIGCSL